MTARKRPEDKLKVGRPSKFRVEFCDALIVHMKKGLSFESFAGDAGVNQDTLYQWVKLHPEFAEAQKTGRTLGQKTLETIGMAGMSGKIPGFVPAAWIFWMKNCYKWRDRQDITSGDAPLPANEITRRVVIVLPSNGREISDGSES